MIAAERTIDVPRERVFQFLAHLPNHWQLDESLVEVESTGDTTASVRLQGPFGIARDARTEVVEAVEPERLRGRADVGGVTVARVGWDLDDEGGRTRVRLTTEIERSSLRDRLVLTCGGNRWLRRVYARALATLERTLTERQ